jgi:hypothetical protein
MRASTASRFSCGVPFGESLLAKISAALAHATSSSLRKGVIKPVGTEDVGSSSRAFAATASQCFSAENARESMRKVFTRNRRDA